MKIKIILAITVIFAISLVMLSGCSETTVVKSIDATYKGCTMPDTALNRSYIGNTHRITMLIGSFPVATINLHSDMFGKQDSSVKDVTFHRENVTVKLGSMISPFTSKGNIKWQKKIGDEWVTFQEGSSCSITSGSDTTNWDLRVFESGYEKESIVKIKYSY